MNTWTITLKLRILHQHNQLEASAANFDLQSQTAITSTAAANHVKLLLCLFFNIRKGPTLTSVALTYPGGFERVHRANYLYVVPDFLLQDIVQAFVLLGFSRLFL